MIKRPFWILKIKNAWQKRSIVWLSGVRRVGKTTLAKMFTEGIYLNCELPSVGRRLLNPELFYDSISGGAIVIFDEIHRLPDPSLVLKIAADEYPHLKILATGSSTLAATKKFRDTLAGRKTNIHLTPVLWNECLTTFNIKNLEHRLFHGGLPEPLLASQKDPGFFSEWIDSFYARDIQELFGVRNRVGFIALFRLLLRQSGGLLDSSNLAKLIQLSRPTIRTYIEALRISNAIFLLPPFSGGGKREIIRRPKCYGFDTGFVTYEKGWNEIREEDAGYLWEHLVLDYLQAEFIESNLFFWRDKSGREIDFIIRESNDNIHAIECKINPVHIDIRSFLAFRNIYPNGGNFVVCPGIKQPYMQRSNQIIIHYCGLTDLSKQLQAL